MSPFRWVSSRPRLWAAVGLLLEAAVTIPSLWLDLPELSAALGISVAVVVAFAAGPRWGLLVAATGAALFFFFAADQEARAALAVPIWLAAALAAGLAGSRQRRTERARRLAAGELDVVRGNAAEAIAELDLDGRIVGWSRGAEQVYGYTADEAEGEELGVVTGADGAEAVPEALERAREGEHAVLDRVEQRRKDGSEIVVSLSLAPLHDEGRVAGVCAVISDVTEQLRAREELEDAEKKYQVLTERLPLVTWLSAPRNPGSVLYISPQIEQLVGYSPDEWRRDPELFSKLLHAEDKQRVLAGREQVAANGDMPLQTEYRLITRSGGVVWVHEETATVRSPRGEPLYVQSLLLDIGERKRAEDEREHLLAAERAAASRTVERQRRLDFLRESTQLLSSSLDYKAAIQRVAQSAVREYADWCVVDMIEDGSPLKRLAVARAELLKHEVGVGPEPEPEPPIAAVVESGTPLVAPPLGESSNGREQSRILGDIDASSAVCVPLRSRKRSLGALTLVRTESRDAYGADDLALVEDLAGRIALAIDRGRLYREVEERADAERVLQHVADGVLLVDRGGAVRLWNPAAEAITAIDAVDVVGRSAVEVIQGWGDAVDSVPVSTTPDPGHAEVVIPIETKRGERWISISGVEFFGGTVYAFRDLTEVRHLEELKADFIATASHELRTPLAAVYGAAQTLLVHDFALDEGGRNRFVKLIVEESERLGRIVNEILLANQLDAGRLDLGSESVNPVEVAERVIESTRAYAPAETAVELVSPKQVRRVAADRDKLRQVLANLVENAIKYSPDGGEIQVGIEEDDSIVRFYVRDEGLGIPVEEQDRVFEKFYRLDPQMTRGVGGTGLGLYICNELVSRMGGRIWVEANEVKGSTFLFELPAEESMPTARRPAEPIEVQLPGSPPHVRHRPSA